jgi:hypothetical protein
MGEVYRARDTRLGREVALKIISDGAALDPERLQRFEQEARLAGSLNHPNLVVVFDVGSEGGAPFLVTELLEGESLRHRLSRGRLPLRTALELGVQLAEGLAAAHARGIVHRDVKPENVFVTSGGRAKLLDFGIAKLTAPRAIEGTRNLLDTTLTPEGLGTRPGAVLGSPGYMSPEQVRGEPVDARTDIFSLGAVLYEMLAGAPAFPAKSLIESGHAILESEPPPLPESVPPSVEMLVRRCLEKEPARRFQSAADLAFDLGAVRHPTGSTGRHLPPSTGWRGRRRLLVAGLTAALLLALTAALVRGRQAPTTGPAVEFEPVTFRWGNISAARFLPDGRTAFSAAFEGNPEQLFVRPAKSAFAQEIGLSDARLMAALGNAELAAILHPKWSNIRTAIGTLATVPSVGGAPRALAEGVEFADYSAKGESLVTRVTGITRTLESPPGKVLFTTTGWLSNPRFSHSGQYIALLHHPISFDDTGEVVLLDRGGQARTLGRRWPATFGLAWSPDDSEIWFSGGRLWKNSIQAVALNGQERTIYTSTSTIELQDISPVGDALLQERIDRVDLFYLSKSGTQRLLSFTDWNASALTGVSDSGVVLFGVGEPVATEEGKEPTLAVLRNVDGSPPQVLARGTPLDLSKDGSLALVESEDGTQLTAVPTGPGQTRTFVTQGLDIFSARFLPGNTSVLLVGRAASSKEARLYRLDGKTVSPVGQPGLGGGIGGGPFLHLSPDARVAAARTPDGHLVLVSVLDESPLPVPSQLLDASPVGWSAQGHLWLRQGGLSAPVRLRLFRANPQTGQVLEERTISPPDVAVSTLIGGPVAVSPNGEHVVFFSNRTPGRLLIARGLWHPK